MTIQGTVVNGVVVPDNGQPLPEGARVEIVLADPKTGDGNAPRSLNDVLTEFAGCMEGLPADLAAQHDHYIHGTPKR